MSVNDGISTDLVTDTNVVSSTVLRVRLSADELSAPGALTFTASRQGGTDRSCSTPCALTLSAQRPAIVGTTPDSISVSSAADVVVNGGYYGTSGSPTVTANFEGQSASIDSANRLHVASPAGGALGLAPLTVTSNVSGATVGPAVANVAIQPSSAPSSPGTVDVGIQPSSVAINTATGIAVVANQGSNSVALIDVSSSHRDSALSARRLNGAVATLPEPTCPASAPTSVAVDNLRNLALVTNSTTKSVAVINLSHVGGARDHSIWRYQHCRYSLGSRHQSSERPSRRGLSDGRICFPH